MLRLVKEIVSKAGKVHFRRWAVLESRLCNIYVHQIARSDEEADPHNHPWPFVSIILRGGYFEQLGRQDGFDLRLHRPGSVLFRRRATFHRIQLLGADAWTLVITGPHSEPWGYETWSGFVDHVTYRKRKNDQPVR